MNNKGVNIYFGDKSLIGFSYVTFLSNFDEIQKHQLSCKIGFSNTLTLQVVFVCLAKHEY